MIFGGSRDIRAVAGFCCRTHARCMGGVIRARPRHAVKSVDTRRILGEWPKNLADMTRGRSRRIFRGFREMQATARFGFRTHTWPKGVITQRRIRNVRRSGGNAPYLAKMGQESGGQVDGQSRRILRGSRKIRAVAGFRFRTPTRRMGEFAAVREW